MKLFSLIILSTAILFTACSSNSAKDITIATLSNKKLDLIEPDKKNLPRKNTAEFYRQFLETAPPSNMYGDAMRRLADLELQTGQEQSTSDNKKNIQKSQNRIKVAIRLYETFLETYPNRKNNDLILYQLAKAYELDLQQEKLLLTLNTIANKFPHSRYIEEVQFRRGEAYFILRNYKQAELAYKSILTNHSDSTYYEKSLYKFGWTRFKQLDYKTAAKSFIYFLDRKHSQGQLLNDGPSPDISRSDKELLNDILRVTSLSFSYQQGHISINNFFNSYGEKEYESIIYSNLAQLYLEKSRIRDAAVTYLAFSKRYPNSSIAPQYHSKAIESYKKGGFASLVLSTKTSFVNQYDVSTQYWKLQTEKSKQAVTPLLKKHIRELAYHYHAKARKNKKRNRKATSQFSQNILQSVTWYKSYIKSFPNDPSTAKINFLLAEAHQDAGQYRNAIYQFEKTAYQYSNNKKNHNAAYAALLLYPPIEKKLKGIAKTQWQQKKIASALKYTQSFPKNKNTPSILASTAEELFKINDYARALRTATILSLNIKTSSKLYTSALLVIGHAEFELNNFEKAEKAYQKIIKNLPPKHKEYKNTLERLAASIYKQGEQLRKTNQLASAAIIFLRIGTEIPSSKLRASADYDAATIYINLKEWNKAQKILESFRKKQTKKHPLQFGVTEKLALVYTKSGKPIKAANEMIALSNSKKYTREQRRQLLWDAARIYNDNKHTKTAKRILAAYVKNYSKPLEPAIEARQLLADFNKKTNRKRYYYWLREIIKADNKGGKGRTQRTHFLAATAYMKLTLPLFKSYKSARLTAPLKRSLKKKKNLMKKVVTSYDNAMKYRVAEITTAATYYIAEIYNDFASALLQSQRPKKLSTDELDEYNVLLEEQAFPFEEKAIDIHAANAERVKDNIYDKWVKLSIAALSKLNPIRYYKKEKGEKYVTSFN